MSTSRSMTPLSVVMERLREKGYGQELIIGKEGAYFEGQATVYQPSSLAIIKVYRFEGESDPADMAVIYAVRADDGTVGYLLNAYGTYSDQDNPFYEDFIRNVRMDEQAEL